MGVPLTSSQKKGKTPNNLHQFSRWPAVARLRAAVASYSRATAGQRENE